MIVLGGECFHSITFYKEYKKFPLKQIFPLLFYNIIIIKTFVSSSTEGGNLAASKIRNLECPSYEICLIDYGCGKFNRKIHIMEQYP